MITVYTAKWLTDRSVDRIVRKQMRRINCLIKKAARQGKTYVAFEFEKFSEKIRDKIVDNLIDKGYNICKYDFGKAFGYLKNRYLISWK